MKAKVMYTKYDGGPWETAQARYDFAWVINNPHRFADAEGIPLPAAIRKYGSDFVYDYELGIIRERRTGETLGPVPVTKDEGHYDRDEEGDRG